MVFGIFKLIGVILFLYLTWRNLKENYQDDRLISYSWLALLVFLVGGRVFYGLINWGVWNDNWLDWLLLWQKPGFSYGGGIGVLLLGSYWYCVVNDWKVWAFFEGMTPIIYFMLVFLMGDEWVRSGFSMNIGIYLPVIIFGWIVFQLVSKRYRSYGWYKSGKKGFGFFFTNAVVCLILALVWAILLNNLISAVIFGILGLISMIGLFILGEVFSNLMVFGQRRNSEKNR